jgi:hypothetical protein
MLDNLFLLISFAHLIEHIFLLSFEIIDLADKILILSHDAFMIGLM